MVENGSYKGKALKLTPGTFAGINFTLKLLYTYLLTAWMPTGSGTDAVTLQINGLGKNSISVTSAFPNWTKIERSFNVLT